MTSAHLVTLDKKNFKIRKVLGPDRDRVPRTKEGRRHELYDCRVTAVYIAPTGRNFGPYLSISPLTKPQDPIDHRRGA